MSKSMRISDMPLGTKEFIAFSLLAVERLFDLGGYSNTAQRFFLPGCLGFSRLIGCLVSECDMTREIGETLIS